MARREAFHFGDCTLEVTERQLLRSTTVVRLSPKAFDVLVALVRHPGHLVTKDELLADVWPESFVEEGILTVHVSALRKALGDDQRPPTYIETVARSGYRFIAPVTRVAADESSQHRARWPGRLNCMNSSGAADLTCSRARTSNYRMRWRRFARLSRSIRPTHRRTRDWRGHSALRRRCAPCPTRTRSRRRKPRHCARWPWTDAADAQVALGTVLFLSEWDWTAAERSLCRALDINPDYTEALLQYGSLQEALGRLDDGLRFKQQALARDPRSALVLVQIAMSYWHQRNYDATLVWAQRALDVDPKHLLASEFIAGVYWKLGDVERLVAENLRMAVTFGVPDEALVNLKQVTARMQDAYATAGFAGVTRFMADHVTNERLDFDHLLKMDFVVPCCTAQRAASMRRSNAWTRRLPSAIRRSCTSPSHRSGTACAAIHGLAIA